MGKFDGILFLSDFDNTILYTADALKNGDNDTLRTLLKEGRELKASIGGT